ncbi:hypothetical protein A628_01011 [Salmonella enterica subsp. enterica serovar Cubana str. 76814]|uniref:Uncharacterized protein n=1 Tax=Salmonella enterica subsp. enterica serovar Cubana str. 76814 TaxID=1192560 RepID=V7IUE1_SALET|nr:hypothetical protein A628_01011 [Salmonella enterica subsp. enterica serovar Cubana str. 76814]
MLLNSNSVCYPVLPQSHPLPPYSGGITEIFIPVIQNGFTLLP